MKKDEKRGKRRAIRIEGKREVGSERRDTREQEQGRKRRRDNRREEEERKERGGESM